MDSSIRSFRSSSTHSLRHDHKSISRRHITCGIDSAELMNELAKLCSRSSCSAILMVSCARHFILMVSEINCPAKSSLFAVPSWSACGTECSGAGRKYSHCFFDGNVHDSPFMVCDELSGPGGQCFRTAFLAILNFREKSLSDEKFLAPPPQHSQPPSQAGLRLDWIRIS